jgi:hypothetical protein
MSVAKIEPQETITRKTRTLYVREEDQEVWDQAKEIIGDSLSTYITGHLKSVVAAKKLAHTGDERIVVKYSRGDFPHAKAFYGRWIIPPTSPFVCEHPEVGDDYYAVAITAKKNVVVFNFWFGTYTENEFVPGRFEVFDSFERLTKSDWIPGGLVSEAMKRQGVEIEELDI